MYRSTTILYFFPDRQMMIFLSRCRTDTLRRWERAERLAGEDHGMRGTLGAIFELLNSSKGRNWLTKLNAIWGVTCGQLHCIIGPYVDYEATNPGAPRAPEISSDPTRFRVADARES